MPALLFKDKYMNRDFKGVWIDKVIWLDSNLSWMEKLFITEINSLDNEDGCFASNDYFSDFFKLSKSRCSQIINSLIKKKYIKAKYEYNGKEIKKRVLNILNTPIKKSKGGIKKMQSGYLGNAKDNNTSSNTNNNIKSKKFKKPTEKEIEEYGKSINYNLKGVNFIDFYEARGWMVGKAKMKDWKAAVRTWRNRHLQDQKKIDPYGRA